jgi:hypothetical protein
MALKSKKVVLLAKIETTYGVDAVPTGASNAILVVNPKLTALTMQASARNVVRPYFANDGKIVAGKHAQLTFDVEISGAGAAGSAPQWGVLMKACAMAETLNAGVSAIYSPISSGEQSVTLYYCIDGIQHALRGVRGSFAMKFAQNGIPMLTFKMFGLYTIPTDTALPVPTFSATRPIGVTQANTTPVTLHGFTGNFTSVSIDVANAMAYRNIINLEEITFTDRQPIGSFDLERPTMAIKDYFSIALAATTGAFTLTHGTVAGNKVQISAPVVQLGAPTLGSANGVETITMAGDLCTNAGNDELVITVL